MNDFGVRGYSKMTKSELPEAVKACTSLSQLFALIQHEGIKIQMHAQSGASNIAPKKLDLSTRLSPLEKMKIEVLKAIGNTSPADALENAPVIGYKTKSVPELITAIDRCTSISQLFAIIQLENLELLMRAHDGASNLKPRKLSAKEIINNNDTPFDRLKAELRCSVIQSAKGKSKIRNS